MKWAKEGGWVGGGWHKGGGVWEGGGGTKWEKSTGSSITEGGGQPSWGRFELQTGGLPLAKPPSTELFWGKSPNWKKRKGRHLKG